MLHKAPDCDPEQQQQKYQPLPVASTSYHDFTKIRYPIIFTKRRTETTYKKSCDHF